MQLLLQRVAASSLLMALTRWSVGCCAWPVLAAVERFAAVLAWPKLLHVLLVEHLVDDALHFALVVDASAAVDAMCLLVAAVAHFVRKNCHGFGCWCLVHMLL